jgi:hypothetical protein
VLTCISADAPKFPDMKSVESKRTSISVSVPNDESKAEKLGENVAGELNAVLTSRSNEADCVTMAALASEISAPPIIIVNPVRTATFFSELASLAIGNPSALPSRLRCYPHWFAPTRTASVVETGIEALRSFTRQCDLQSIRPLYPPSSGDFVAMCLA